MTPAAACSGFVNTMRDVSVQRRQQAELERLARTDALTGVANRHVLQEALGRAAQLTRLPHTAVSSRWCCSTSTGSSRSTTRYGHPAGDAVLVQVARRLGATVRAGEGSAMARVGGEEFAGCCPTPILADAVIAADRARAMISSEPFPLAGTLTMSAGVESSPGPTRPTLGVPPGPGWPTSSTASRTARCTRPS